jgi:flagellar basal-body rod modification protein FlgD
MTDIISTTGVGTSAKITAADQASQDAAVNFDTFIKLLVAQLQNQDPLNPVDGTEFTQQIATFSALEQQIASNKHLEQLVAQNSYAAQGIALNMMGKEVLAPGNVANVINGKMDFAYELDASAVAVTLEIIDGSGQVVKTIEANRTKGVHAEQWDGTMDNGQKAADGAYTIRLRAFDNDGNSILSQVYAYGRVVSVESLGSADSTSLLLSDGRVVGFNSIGAVREPVVAQQPQSGGNTTGTDNTDTDADDEPTV